MDLNHRLAISYYKTIASINEAHQIDLVQHQITQKIFIKKILTVYNRDVYEHLFTHPIIGTPKIIDYIEEEHNLILIEEFISGTSLLEKIETKSLSSTDILNYMFDLCKILEELHSQSPSIIHRDIKPSNIIISSYNRAILLDFNAAKYYAPHSTEDTVLLGTQGYAAPEQYGFGASSPQTDIYALGILLKEMTTSIAYKHPKIDAIIHKCTQMNPSDRYFCIHDLLQDLLLLTTPEQQTYLPHKSGKYAFPGFRSKTPWKMMMASICYLFVSWLCLSLEIENVYGLNLWIERIFIYAMILFVILGSCNYLNVQQLVPLCQNPNKFIKFLGVFLLDIAVVFCLFIIMFIIESLCFST